MVGTPLVKSRPSSVAFPSRRGHPARIITHAALIMGAVVLMAPLAWMISTSLKDLGEVFFFPPRWIPRPPRWENYRLVFEVIPFGRYIRNTTMITFFSVIGKLLSCSLVAYSFARLRWRGRDVLFMVMLATVMLPYQVTMIPEFVLYRFLGLIDTFVPLVLPHWFGGPFLTFLLRQFFLTIPLELDDAARIDGASIFGIFARIVLPLATPALTAVAIFQFNASWNAFLQPLIYLHSQENFTIALGLRSFQDQFYTEWNLLMAASVIAMIPSVVIFFFAQKYFIQGIVFTGIKG